MKFRCPYCRHTFGPEPQPKCPNCGKAMLIPENIHDKQTPGRKEMFQKAAQAASEMRKAARIPGPDFFHRPSVVLPGLALLLVVGGMLLLQATRTVQQHRPERTNQSIAANNLKTLRIALERFKIDCGRYPTTEEGLPALVLNPGVPGWRHNYVRSLRKSDPWLTPYHYACSDGVVTLYSCGLDMRPGTADDIVPADPLPAEVDWPPDATTNVIETPETGP